ncbi:MAG: DegT/DnrJ/EryC1/StrS family aminotransferase [Phycisphaerales bacterium]|nr:DegT/DnrJ/EryC1/StrS family aminotransferase [Phycisphaerales bacterium]
MKIQFHNPGRTYQAHRREIDAAVARVLSSGRYILGAEVEQFESEFAQYTGTKHAVGVASGTDALVVALRALEIGIGDEVVMAANAGGYATTACVLVGATPVYADVIEPDFTLDPQSVERMTTEKTKAIIATHLYGSMCDVVGLQELTRRNEISLIEDCAQSHGATLSGKRAGSFGDVATFSFYPTKNLGALGDGGMVVCQGQGLADELFSLRQYGWSSKYTVKTAGGMNTRLDPIQAAILRTRLPHLDDNNARRRQLADLYAQRLSPLGLEMVRAEGEAFVGHLCVVRSDARDSLKHKLTESKIGTDIHYPILDPDQPGWANIGWRSDDLPVSRLATKRILSLPMYPELTIDEVNAVCDAIELIVSEDAIA